MSVLMRLSQLELCFVWSRWVAADRFNIELSTGSTVW